MVQADPLRDYYQDLGIQPTCSQDDVQKAFRKLALKFHPDRNPGCEDEFKAKFQTVQAAHEVLMDPERRQKYDLDRKKQLARNSRPVPPRSAYSTFTTAPSNYPPPPRRTAPFTQQAPPRPPPPRPQASTASTAQNGYGANRFTQFPRPPPTAQRPNTKDDADARRNVFHAWERMNPNKTPPNMEDAANARARTSTANHASTANTAKPGLGRSNTTRAPRKSGFDPATPGADEPQAHGSAYYTTARHSLNPPPDQPESNHSTPRKADPLRPFRSHPGYDEEVPFTEGRRHRTPYSSNSGERTHFSSEGLGRSASTRSSPRQFSENDASDPSTARPSRHRSVSPKPQRPPFPTSQTTTKPPPRHKPGGNATRPFAAFEMYDSSEEEEGELFSAPPRPKAGDPRRANAFPQKSPKAGGQAKKPNGAGTAQSSAGGTPTKMYDSFPFNVFKDNTWTALAKSARPSIETAYLASPAKAVPAEVKSAGFAKHANSNGTAYLAKLAEALSARAKPAEAISTEARAAQAEPAQAILAGFAKYANSPWIFPSSVLPKKDSSNAFSQSNTGRTLHPSRGYADPTSFNIPSADETFKANFPGVKSRSAESINTTFSPDAWNGTFQGTSDYFAVPTGTARNAKSRQSPTRGRASSRPQSSTHQTSSQGPPPPPPPPPFFAPPQQTPHMPPPPPPPISTQAAPGAPPVKFSPQEWQQTFKEPSWVYPTTSPSRPNSTSSKRSNPPKTRKGSAPPKSATVTDPADEPTQNGTSKASPVSVSSDSSNAMEIDSETPPVNGTRRESVREARTVPASPHRADWKDQAPKQSATAPASATEPHGPGLNGLGGLRNVAPFAPTTDGGLRDLNDLGSTLPFNSAASVGNPLKPTSVEKLDLPQIPKAPDEPTHLTKQSFQVYIQRMYNYIANWNKFNNDMVNHFRGRQESFENLTPNWLAAVGEPTGKLGFDSYMLALAEDERIRAVWDSGCQHHQTGMEVCQRVRLRATKGLPDA